MAATQEDLASLVLSIRADLSKVLPDLAKLAKAGAAAAKETEDSFKKANDNINKGFSRTTTDATRSLRATRAEASNMANQFQDIFVQLQGGASPFLVATQQGTQLASVLQNVQAQGGGLFKALGGALGSFLNPIQIITIGVIALGGALIKAFSGGADATQKQIDAFEKTIAKLKDLQSIAEATGATSLEVDLTAKIDEAQVAETVAKLKQIIQDVVSQGTSGKTDWSGIFNSLNNAINDFWKNAGEKVGLRSKAIDAIGDTFSRLANTAPQTEAAGKQLDELTHKYDALQKALTGTDANAVKKAMEDLGMVVVDALDPTAVKVFFDAFEAAKPSVQKSIDIMQKVAPAIKHAGDNTDEAKKKAAEYNREMQKLEGASSTLGKHDKEIQDIIETWAKARAAARNYGEQVAADAAANAALTQKSAEQHQQVMDDANADTVSFLKKWEGFQPFAKWDVNHFRLGFGSSTITTEGGQVIEVVKGMETTIEDATRDLERRIPEFQAKVIEAIGSDFWEKLSEDQKTALTSLAYNYGHLPSSIAKAIKAGGGAGVVGQAIADLNRVPGTVNFERRQSEAALFGGEQFKAREGFQQALDNQRQNIALSQQEIEIMNNLTLTDEERAGSLARVRTEQELLNKAKADGLANDPAVIASIHAEGQAAYDNAVAKEKAKQATEDYNKAQKETEKNAQAAANAFAQLGTSFVSTFVNDLKAGKSAADAFRDALANLAEQLANMIISGLFQQLGNSLFGVPTKMLGGPVGSPHGIRRYVSPYAFVGAPRMAAGGFVGVRPGEFPTILHRGEVVIPASMVRSAMRLPNGSASQGQGNTTITLGDVSIRTELKGTGDVKGDTEQGKQMGRSILAIVQAEITRQSRPGGLLTASGSAGRVGR